MISVADGSVRSVESLAGYASPAARCSPDGRFIAFQRNKPANIFDSDLFIMRADGSEGRSLLDDLGTADLVGWVPDGSGLLFLSDRGSSLGLSTVPVADGRDSFQIPTFGPTRTSFAPTTPGHRRPGGDRLPPSRE